LNPGYLKLRSILAKESQQQRVRSKKKTSPSDRRRERSLRRSYPREGMPRAGIGFGKKSYPSVPSEESMVSSLALVSREHGREASGGAET